MFECLCVSFHLLFILTFILIIIIQFSSVAQSFLTVCDLMDYSTPGFPVLHYLPDFAQTLVRCVDDAIQLCPNYSLYSLILESSLYLPQPLTWLTPHISDIHFKITPQDTDSREQTYGHGKAVGAQGRGEEGGMYGETNMETYTLPYVK